MSELFEILFVEECKAVESCDVSGIEVGGAEVCLYLDSKAFGFLSRIDFIARSRAGFE